MTLNNVIDKELNTGSGRMVPAKFVVTAGVRLMAGGSFLEVAYRVSTYVVGSNASSGLCTDHLLEWVLRYLHVGNDLEM